MNFSRIFREKKFGRKNACGSFPHGRFGMTRFGLPIGCQVINKVIADFL
jgi:hypothetical protein